MCHSEILNYLEIEKFFEKLFLRMVSVKMVKSATKLVLCSYIVVIPMGDSGSHCVANMSGPGGGTGVPQIQSDTLK